PSQHDAATPRAPREATFVIDTSGSMSGVSIAQAREAVLFALSRLVPGDRFNVIAFASTTDALFAAPVAVDATSLAAARRFVTGLRANGGTEMKPALEQALSAPPAPGFVQQVVFLTDGAVGNEQELLKLIGDEAGARRLFTVGIGPGPNAYFLRKAAQFGRGTATFIGDVSEVNAKMTALYVKLERPALTAVDTVWSAPADVYPPQLPDLYDGEPIVMTASFATPAVTLSLTGRRGGHAFGTLLPLSAGAPAHGIAALWARDRIAALSDAQAAGADEASLRPQIVQTALEHHLVSRYTSLVAVDVTPTAPGAMSDAETALPLNVPAGVDAAGILGALPQTATPAPLLFAIGTVALLLAACAFAAWRRGPRPSSARRVAPEWAPLARRARLAGYIC
ncbi:MAG: VWA domain-containing protein, partial [Proteobacteria bacterium]|nr:VWA domain-containing protein [Pseudomonadota bacterium]